MGHGTCIEWVGIYTISMSTQVQLETDGFGREGSACIGRIYQGTAPPAILRQPLHLHQSFVEVALRRDVEMWHDKDKQEGVSI